MKGWKFYGHKNSLFEQWKVGTFFQTECFLNLSFSDLIVSEKLESKLEKKNDCDLETCSKM